MYKEKHMTDSLYCNPCLIRLHSHIGSVLLTSLEVLYGAESDLNWGVYNIKHIVSYNIFSSNLFTLIILFEELYNIQNENAYRTVKR